MTTQRTYPAGVTSWVDLEVAQLDTAVDFYAGLFGWTFQQATPDGAPSRYLVAQLDGQDVAGLGSVLQQGGGTPEWRTYVAVEDADAAASLVGGHGGTVLDPPADAGDGGRSALCADPEGARFGLWQARRRLGAQVTNAPGTWNFSDLHTADPEHAPAFYREVFGWEVADLGFARLIRRPGYGDHLAATTDPTIHERQAEIAAPPGFADAIGWVVAVAGDERPHWHVSFTVADRDATVASAERLGGTVLGTRDTDWTLDALLADPLGARFTVSQFEPDGT